MHRRVTTRALWFETLERRVVLSADAVGGWGVVAPDATNAVEAAVVEHTANSQSTAWASTRGLYVFNVAAYQGDWAPREWTLPQWETWLDTMQFLGLNHLQLPRAPWSERPGETAFELEKEDLWVDVLQAAKDRGMTTSIIFGTTHHGDPGVPWRILTPGAGPADPNWQTLVADYQYWAQKYGTWVDEWVMGVEDPGGSPSSSGQSWPYDTPSPLGDPSYVTQLVALELEMRDAARAVNPSSTVVAETWGLHWWGLGPGYNSHLDEFLANEPLLPADVPLSTHGNDNALTDALQATGRDVDAWPFFLIDHEFPAGHTRLYFNWTSNYLQRIESQGIDDVVAHISHPMEQLPAVYVYARLLEDPNLNKDALLNEFAGLIVSDPSDQAELANAISQLGLYWESVSGIANWDLNSLQPVDATAPYASRYSTTQLAYLDSALTSIESISSVRTDPMIPMVVSGETWVGMLRDQIGVLHDAANIGALVQEGINHLDSQYGAVAGIDGPIGRNTADAIVDAYLSAGSAGALDAMEAYLGQFWQNTSGLASPLGIIYDFLRTNISTENAGLATVAGDFLEYDAPSYSTIFKQIADTTQETDGSFSYLRSEHWNRIEDPAYSGGAAMATSLTNNEVSILFAGSGISLIHSLWIEGGNVQWSIDGGAGGSGVFSMHAAERQDQVETLLASGLDSTLHVLKLRKSVGGGSILIDGVKVVSPSGAPIAGDYDSNGVVDTLDYQVWASMFGDTVALGSGADGNGNGVIDAADYTVWRDNEGRTDETLGGLRLRRESDHDLLQYAGAWVETTEGSPSGGSWSYTLDAGASLTVPFEGSAVAISATTRGDYGEIAWSIDGGAGGSGVVSLASSYNTFNVPFILSTSLTDGPHTLELHKASGFLINIDSVDSIGSSTPAAAASFRIEAESTGVVKGVDDAVGYDSINGVVGRIDDPTASGGELLVTQGANRAVKLVFVGEGVNLVTNQVTNGALMEWVLDEGAMSGVIDTSGAGGPQTIISIIDGLDRNLHTLELRFLDTPQPTGATLSVDAFEVINSANRTRIENDDPAIVYSTNWLSTIWQAGDQIVDEASGASLAVSITQGTTATVEFMGNAVALIADVRADGGIFSYSIDGGAVTGLIDLREQNSLGYGNWHRWPILLSNDLAPGVHTLLLRAVEANSGGRGAVNFDAIDVYGASGADAIALSKSEALSIAPSGEEYAVAPLVLTGLDLQANAGSEFVYGVSPNAEDRNHALLLLLDQSAVVETNDIEASLFEIEDNIEEKINESDNAKTVDAAFALGVF